MIFGQRHSDFDASSPMLAQGQVTSLISANISPSVIMFFVACSGGEEISSESIHPVYIYVQYVRKLIIMTAGALQLLSFLQFNYISPTPVPTHSHICILFKCGHIN